MSRATVAKGWRSSRTSPLKTRTMATASSRRSGFISTANYLAGQELLSRKYFMLRRRLGTTIHTRSQLPQCSFLPKFSIHIETKYEDNKGSNDSIFDSEAKDLEREVCFIDIASDEIPERYYKESEDPKHFKSEKTGRGQLREGWRDNHQPIMCSYKLVTVKFEVWGLQTRVEQFVHKVVRDILLIGHRQAFAWVDEWYDMTMDEVREFERATQEATNKKIGVFPPAISISSISLLPSSIRSAPSSAPSTPLSTDAPEFLTVPKDRPRKKSAPETLTLPDPGKSSTQNLPSVRSSDKHCRPKQE
uniref:Phosphatidylinositol transfer protein cytoplasmic 1 n=1 Tax=Ornithorhynchus anatinus TaxID=9258 RepID=A0A6I8P579_ORNAN